MQVLWGLARPYLRVFYSARILPVQRRVLLCDKVTVVDVHANA